MPDNQVQVTCGQRDSSTEVETSPGALARRHLCAASLTSGLRNSGLDH